MFEEQVIDKISGRDPSGTNREGPWAGIIHNTPVSLEDKLYVVIPGITTEIKRGPCSWVPRVDSTGKLQLPTVGDTCLFIEDDNKQPWVVAWWPHTFAPPTGPPLVTSLPSSPYDGQEINYMASEANGVVWRFRYHSGSASTHKWEFVGGSDVVAYQETDASGPASPAAAFAFSVVSNTAAFTIPIAGDYDVLITQTFLAQNEEVGDFRAACVSYPSATLLGNVYSEAGFAVATAGGTVRYAPVWNPSRCSGVAAGTVAVIGFSGSNPKSSVRFYGGIMRVRPVRVG